MMSYYCNIAFSKFVNGVRRNKFHLLVYIVK